MIDIDSIQLFGEGISRYTEMLYSEKVSVQQLMHFRDALSRGQLQSKLHILKLAQELKITSKQSLFIGHWHGLLPYLFFISSLTEEALGLELDPLSKKISENVCRGYRWESKIEDATKLEESFFRKQSFDVVINTSCEHMSFDWLRFVPRKTHIIAQANNYDIPEHTYRQNSLESFKNNLGLTSVLHSDEIDFGVYKRFTIIGQK